MKRICKRLLLLVVATALVSTLAEVAYRAVRPAPRQSMYFRDAARNVVPDRPTPTEDLEFRRGIQAAWPRPEIPSFVPQTPRPGETVEWFGTGYAMPRDNLLGNVTWLPGSTFHLCYRGPTQPYFDGDGCVAMHFNRFGMRDAEDRTLAKPAGTRRILCLGDSFTLGWGVRADHNWPVLVEERLRLGHPELQVVNGGGTGSAYVDEYELALRHRHGRFDPDLVVVTLCLNDLLITNGKLCHYREDALPDDLAPDRQPALWEASALLRDAVRAMAQAHALDLDPGRDWTAELMALPADHACYQTKGETPAIYWVGGTPQRALRGMRDWCAEHRAAFAVVIWPLLQGLGPGRHYPFQGIHAKVAEFCAAEHIPLLDLLPTLQAEAHETLWVSPGDMHPNETAQRLATPLVADFLAQQLGWK